MPRHTGDGGNSTVYAGSAAITANLTTADKVRPVFIPGGNKAYRVAIRNPDLDSGTTLAVNIGFSNVDGTPGPSATAVASAVTTWQGAATTIYELMPPVTLEKDAYLEIVPTVGGIGTGTVHGRVEGEAIGIR